MLLAARSNRQTKQTEEKLNEGAARNRAWMLPTFRQTKRGQEEMRKGQVGKHYNCLICWTTFTNSHLSLQASEDH